MNEVIERGIELLEELETESDIVESEEEIRDLRKKSELFDALSSFSGFVLVRSSTIDELLDVLNEGSSLNEFLRKQRNWVLEDLEIQKTVSKLAQNYSKNFASLVEIIQQVSDTFRSFYVLASSEPEKKVVIHPNCFHKFPELIAAQLQGILDFLGFNIRYRVVNDRILLEWKGEAETDEGEVKLTDYEFDIDSRLGIYKDFKGRLEDYTAEGAKTEKELFREIISVATNLEIPEWDQGLFTTGNRRYTYLPQEYVTYLMDELTIHEPERINSLLTEFGTKLRDIQFPHALFASSDLPKGVESVIQRLRTIFNDYFGWGRADVTQVKQESALLTLQNPIFSCAVIKGIIDGYIGPDGYQATLKRSVEEGHYRCEFAISRSNITILIVDDEKRILNSLAKTLEREEELSYDILTAESGEQALEIFQENANAIDLILCDHNMPGLKGTEVLEKIRLENPEVVRILITGYSEIDIAKDAINKARIHFFVEKPPEAQELRDIVKQELRKRKETL